MPIPLFKVFMDPSVEAEVPKVLMSGMITQAKKVEEFEGRLKEYFNHPYVVTVNSATAALTLGIKIAGASAWDVISSPLTCFATTSAILAAEVNRIIWADVDHNTCNIDLEDVKKKIGPNTRVLVYVHWAGVPVNPNKVKEIKDYAKSKFNIDLQVVEDCAHAFGAEWNGQKIGTFGNFAAFSFQAIKHLTTGDGGVLLCPDESSYQRAKLLRWYGIDREHRSKPCTDFRLEPDIAESGYKFHMNDINATIGLCNLPRVDTILQRNRENAKYYMQELKNIMGIELPMISVDANPSYWIFTIRILFKEKENFMSFMTEKGIVVSQVHARNDKNSCVKHWQSSLPSLDQIEKEIISIPVGWWVSEEGRKYIVQCCKEFFSQYQIRQVQSDTERYNYIDLIKQMNNYSSQTNNLSDEQLEEIYALFYNNIMVGTAKLHIENKLYEPVGHIEDVVVDSSYRHRGYGQALVKYLVNLANDMGCYKAVLACKPELASFYKSCGLKETGLSFTSYRLK